MCRVQLREKDLVLLMFGRQAVVSESPHPASELESQSEFWADFIIR